MSAKTVRCDAYRRRPRHVTTLDPDTVDALNRIAEETGESRGRIVDAAVTHPHACRCPICTELSHDRASKR